MICPGCGVDQTAVLCPPCTSAELKKLYAHWSTVPLALKAMTKERDALLLQNQELQKIVNDPHAALVTCEAKFKALASERDELLRLYREAFSHLEYAWSVIASAGPPGCIGNWEKMDKNWVAGAERWRDVWHELLRERAARKEQESEKLEGRS